MLSVRLLAGVLALLYGCSGCHGQQCGNGVFSAEMGGICHCGLDHRCSGPACLRATTSVSYNELTTRLTHELSVFYPSCTSCRCVPLACPAGSSQLHADAGALCRCHRPATPSDTNATCIGSYCHRLLTARDLTQPGGRPQLWDIFQATCSDCQCLPCPIRATKDSDGDCQCPGDEFCEGSYECRESRAMTQQVGSYTHHISDHVHFFHPRCGEACVCSANALEEFAETALRAVPQDFWINSTENTVAGLCGERCLNTAGCAGFLSGVISSIHQRNSGQCVLLRGSGFVAGEALERAVVPSTEFDLFLRNDAPNPCDARNGGCGDVAFTSCTFSGGAAGVTCTDIDECLVNNGGCGMGMCTNQPGAAAVCGGRGSGSGGALNFNCTGTGDVYGCNIDGITRPAPSDSTPTTPTTPMLTIGTLNMPVSRSLAGWSMMTTIASSSASVGKNGSEGAAVPIVTIVLAVLVALAFAAVVLMYIKKFRGGGGGGGGAWGAARPGMAAARQLPELDPRDAFENPLYDDIEVEPREASQREVSAAGGALGNNGYAEVAPFCPTESVSEGAGYEFETNGMMSPIETDLSNLDVVPAGAGSGYMDVRPMNDAVVSGAGEGGNDDGGYMEISPVSPSDSRKTGR